MRYAARDSDTLCYVKSRVRIHQSVLSIYE